MSRFRDPPITLSEMDGVRYLHFGSEWVQGAMRIRDPARIEIEYVRQMMAWLLFLDEGQRILQLGLGAGALTRFCHKHLPSAQITVVERSARVLQAVRQYFALPRDDRRLSVLIDDAERHLRAAPAGSQDVIQVDLYDEHARGPVIDSSPFYGQCFRVLGQGSVMAVNLFGDDRGFDASVARIGEAFEGRVMTLPRTLAGNVVVLAFKGPAIEIEWSMLERRAQALETMLSLECSRWVASLRSRSAPASTRFEI